MPTRTTSARPYLWERLRCPIWCTRFTAAVLRASSTTPDQGRGADVVAPGERFMVGPFDCSLVRVTHSIPDPMRWRCARRSATCCTRATGSWIRRRWSGRSPRPTIWSLRPRGRARDDRGLDQHPQPRHLRLGSRGARQPAGADRRAREPGRADHLRLQHRAPRDRAAWPRRSDASRGGRALHASHDRGRARGRLSAGLPPLLDERAASELPRSKVLWLATGCQGEPRAALSGSPPASTRACAWSPATP